MNAVLQFDFSVNKETKTVHVTREFAADQALVWSAWTNPELLDQWWAPKPWQNKTKTMDMRNGGLWLYSMTGPDGSSHWCRLDYTEVENQKSYSGLDAFCDENGVVNKDWPRSEWTTVFNTKDENTVVDITLKFDQLSDLEKTIEMGFKEGFTMGLNQLEVLLATLKKQA